MKQFGMALLALLMLASGASAQGIVRGGGTSRLEGANIEVGAQPADDPHYVRCSDGTEVNPCEVTVTNTVTVTGALSVTSNSENLATAANQTTANNSLSAIASNTNNAAASVAAIEEDTDAIATNTAGILAALQEDEALIVCDRSALVVGKSTTGATEVIPASETSSDKIYICSYTVQAEGTTTWQFQQGTGSDCASDTAALPGAAAWSFSLTTGMLGVNRGGGIGSILDSDAGQAVCVTQGSAVQTNFEIRYTYLTPAGS